MFCAICNLKNCAKRMDAGNGNPLFPGNCPTKLYERNEEILKEYFSDEEDLKLARASAVCAPDHSEGRIMKTLRFAKECGYTKLGLAFCSALRDQAAEVYRIIKDSGFEVESIICKVGRFDRSVIGAPPSCNPMCNPIAQAELLNEAGTELNLVLGLCVGHDSLFIKHSKAPVTVIAVKDHVYDNAPLRYLDDLKIDNT